MPRPGQVASIIDPCAFMCSGSLRNCVVPVNTVQNTIPHRCRLGDAWRDAVQLIVPAASTCKRAVIGGEKQRFHRSRGANDGQAQTYCSAKVERVSARIGHRIGIIWQTETQIRNHIYNFSQ